MNFNDFAYAAWKIILYYISPEDACKLKRISSFFEKNTIELFNNPQYREIWDIPYGVPIVEIGPYYRMIQRIFFKKNYKPLVTSYSSEFCFTHNLKELTKSNHYREFPEKIIEKIVIDYISKQNITTVTNVMTTKSLFLFTAGKFLLQRHFLLFIDRKNPFSITHVELVNNTKIVSHSCYLLQEEEKKVFCYVETEKKTTKSNELKTLAFSCLADIELIRKSQDKKFILKFQEQKKLPKHFRTRFRDRSLYGSIFYSNNRIFCWDVYEKNYVFIKKLEEEKDNVLFLSSPLLSVEGKLNPIQGCYTYVALKKSEIDEIDGIQTVEKKWKIKTTFGKPLIETKELFEKSRGFGWAECHINSSCIVITDSDKIYFWNIDSISSGPFIIASKDYGCNFACSSLYLFQSDYGTCHLFREYGDPFSKTFILGFINNKLIIKEMEMIPTKSYNLSICSGGIYYETPLTSYFSFPVLHYVDFLSDN